MRDGLRENMPKLCFGMFSFSEPQLTFAKLCVISSAIFKAAFTEAAVADRRLAGALAGIFVLVQHHGLEYPQFYDRLYSLLDAQAFHTRYRKRFFDLMDVFLKSPLLPAYIGAAFAKRFARLAISAPPSGASAACQGVTRKVPA